MKFSKKKSKNEISILDFLGFFGFFRLIGEWIWMSLNDENSSQGQEKNWVRFGFASRVISAPVVSILKKLELGSWLP